MLVCILHSHLDRFVRHNEYTALTAFTQNNSLVPRNPQLNKYGPRFASSSTAIDHITAEPKHVMYLHTMLLILNSLIDNIIACDSINGFKNRLDKFLYGRGFTLRCVRLSVFWDGEATLLVVAALILASIRISTGIHQ